MMKNNFILVLIAIFIIGCSSNTQEIQINSILSRDVIGESIQMPANIFSPRKIFALKSEYALLDDKDNNAFLKIVDYSSSNTLRYGMVGRGSSEFTSPSVYKNSENSLVITSLNSNNKIITVENQQFSTEDIVLENEKKIVGCNYLAKLNKDSFLFTSTSNNQVSILDDKTSEIVAKNYYPFTVNNVSDFELANVIFDSNISYSHIDNTIFVLYKYYPRAMTINVKDDKVISNIKLNGNLIHNNYSENENGVVDFYNPTLFYTYGVVTKSFKWGLFQNSERSKLKDGASKSEIHKFSSDGILIERIILDRCIYHFDVTPDEKYIYTLSINSDIMPEITKYIIL